MGKSKNQQIDHKVIQHDAYDQLAFESVADYGRVAALSQGTDKTSTDQAQALVQDVFTSFYKIEPQVRESESLSKDIVNEFLGMKEYKDFHETSMLDAVPSAFGACSMVPALLQKLEEINEQIQQQREQQRENNREQGKDENEGVPSGGPRLEELGDEGKAGLRQAIRQAVEKAQKENDDNQALMRQWGVDTGETKQMDALARLKLADQLKESGKLKNVSQLLGRFKNVINAAVATVPSHGNDEIVDIATGDDIARMIPTEAIKLLQNPNLFYKDFAEKNLMVYNMKGTDTLGKGPLMVCFDISGSMAGSREEWAKAVVLALLHYAQQQKRAFAWVSFESRVHDSALYQKGEKVSIDEKIRIAKITTTGGTDFWSPLERCMELHAQTPELKPADIIFITDGECRVQQEQLDEFTRWKKDKGVRCFGVGISDASHFDHASFPTLETFADQVCMVNNLGDVSALKQVVAIAQKERV